MFEENIKPEPSGEDDLLPTWEGVPKGAGHRCSLGIEEDRNTQTRPMGLAY